MSRLLRIVIILVLAGAACAKQFPNGAANNLLIAMFLGLYPRNTPCQSSGTSLTSFYAFFGGAGVDQATAVCATSDGGLLLVGRANANLASLQGKTPNNAYTGNYDWLVIRLDATGIVTWYTFIGSAGGLDEAKSVTETSDGGWLVAGLAGANIPSLQGLSPRSPYTGLNDVLITRLDTSGNAAWYTFLGSAGGSDVAYSVAPAADGGVVLAGFSTAAISSLQGKTPVSPYVSGQDMLVAKVDSAGDVSWYTFLGAAGTETAYGVATSSDGGYFVVGDASNVTSLQGKSPLNAWTGSSDFLMAKLDSAGNVSWFTRLGGINTDTPNGVVATSDGGLAVTGDGGATIASVQGRTPRNAYSGGSDFLTARLDSTGNIVWYSFMGSAAGTDVAKSISVTQDGSVVVVGTNNMAIPPVQGRAPNNPYSGLNDALIARLDTSGDVSWYTFLGSAAGTDNASGVVGTSDGGFFVAGDASANITSIYGQSPRNAYSASNDWFVLKLKPDGNL